MVLLKIIDKNIYKKRQSILFINWLSNDLSLILSDERFCLLSQKCES